MDAERSFREFRQHRDPARLGEVFDLVADELFAVALHVCPDRAAAEDVVQSTFLTAIERAHRWDAARPLRPWLLGILQREAKREWRRRARRRQHEQVAAGGAPPPEQFVLAAEVREAVTAAIRSMPQPYREVLELRLLQGLSNAGIAARKQRAPGVVRTQLWRGLEMLRGLLPKGIALGAAGQLAPQAGLAAVRARVVAAAVSPKAVGAIGALAGVLVMKKVLVAAAALVVCASLTWIVWPRAAEESERLDAARAATVATADLQDPAPAASPAQPRRELVERPHQAAASPAPASAPAAAGFAVDVALVDPQGHPVADAELGAYEPSWATDKKDRRSLRERREAAEPFLRVRTDVAGRARLAIPHEACFLLGHKEGVGTTGDILVRQRPREELRLVLVRPVRIAGVVLDAHGAPLAGASVEVDGGGSHPAVAPPAQRTGGDGRFAFVVVAGGSYRVAARDQLRWSSHVAVNTFTDRSDREVVLRFPGAFSVRGLLLDERGQPMRGRVFVVAEAMVRARPGQWHGAEAGTDGRFEVLLNEGGAHHVCGGIEGWTPGIAKVELDDAFRHREVTLQVRPFLPVDGQVVDEHGVPCAGVHVGLGLADPGDAFVSRTLELTGILPRGDTDRNGRFRFLAPAHLRYRLGVKIGHLYAHKQEVALPASGVVITLVAADRQGFTVAGHVFDARTRTPVPAFRVQLLTHSGNGHRSQVVARVQDAGGRFEVGPFPARARYSLTIEAEDYAETDVGPFDATVRREEVRVDLPPCGRVAVRVLHGDGRPAVKVHVGLVHVPDRPFGRAHQGPTDGEGRIVLDGVVPGRCRVGTFPPGEPARHVWQEVEVVAGGEAEVRLVLP